MPSTTQATKSLKLLPKPQLNLKFNQLKNRLLCSIPTQTKHLQNPLQNLRLKLKLNQLPRKISWLTQMTMTKSFSHLKRHQPNHQCSKNPSLLKLINYLHQMTMMTKIFLQKSRLNLPRSPSLKMTVMMSQSLNPSKLLSSNNQSLWRKPVSWWTLTTTMMSQSKSPRKLPLSNSLSLKQKQAS